MSIPGESPMQSLSENKSKGNPDSGWLSLKDLCSILSISLATGRNWVRLGKVTPQKNIKGTPYFSRDYIYALKESLESGEITALKSRRNKKYISGTNVYRSYLSSRSQGTAYLQAVLDAARKYQISLGESKTRILLAECACRLLLYKTELASPLANSPSSCLAGYLEGRLGLEGYDFLIDDIISDREEVLSFIHNYPDFFAIPYRCEKKEDLLGFLYISFKSLGDRKSRGAYYTPSEVVMKLCGQLFHGKDHAGKKILDPCCGTGNFLLNLPGRIAIENIYGNDIDQLSIKICRINLAIKYRIKDRSLLYSHFTCRDYLSWDPTEKYDYIIGNPPWGCEFSEEEKERLKKCFLTASGRKIESYDLFIEQALASLSMGGCLSLVLPESLLFVKGHRPIRRILCQSCSFQYIEYLGNIFEGVHCPCIIFQVKYTGSEANCVGMIIREGNRVFTIQRERSISEDRFPFLTSDEEEDLLKKINSGDDKCYLEGNATFALGMVTGDNKKYLLSKKEVSKSISRTASMEKILKGSDIYKYHAREASNYIEFKPESFQQTTPEAYYRAPEKLLYRFICRQLVFAYDDRQSLSLNSCNLLIPHLKGLSVKYVLAILNSRIAGYYFKKSFHSVKVLRSHIEQIPIPYAEKKQQEEILTYVESLLAADEKTDILKIYNKADQLIARLYGLSPYEYSLILESMEGENLFLV